MQGVERGWGRARQRRLFKLTRQGWCDSAAHAGSFRAHACSPPHATFGRAASGQAAQRRAAEFSRRLRAWYRRNARDLPWRQTRDAYRILVSELMLQQTQVSRVLDFYERFLVRFPDLASLASAREAHVLAQWRGLGYYARARNLHKLARRVV
ncbi:MAG: hypothetical protein WC700_18960, partial [Gemmatimonadaceae bacterium]